MIKFSRPRESAYVEMNGSGMQDRQIELVRNLFKFVAEIAQNLVAPIYIVDICKAFKERKGCEHTQTQLEEALKRHRYKVPYMTEFDLSTKVRILYATNSRIPEDFLRELREVATVELDEKRRITSYISEKLTLPVVPRASSEPLNLEEVKPSSWTCFYSNLAGKMYRKRPWKFSTAKSAKKSKKTKKEEVVAEPVEEDDDVIIVEDSVPAVETSPEIEKEREPEIEKSPESEPLQIIEQKDEPIMGGPVAESPEAGTPPEIEQRIEPMITQEPLPALEPEPTTSLHYFLTILRSALSTLDSPILSEIHEKINDRIQHLEVHDEQIPIKRIMVFGEFCLQFVTKKASFEPDPSTQESTSVRDFLLLLKAATGYCGVVEFQKKLAVLLDRLLVKDKTVPMETIRFALNTTLNIFNNNNHI